MEYYLHWTTTFEISFSGSSDTNHGSLVWNTTYAVRRLSSQTKFFSVLQIGSYKCQCGESYKVKKDRRSCKYTGDDHTTAYLLFTDRYDIRVLSLDGKSYNTLLSELINVVAVDFDYKEKRIFWSTNSPKGIKSAKMDGTDIKTIVKLSRSSPDGMAVDWVGRNLYFCEASEATIYVSKLNGFNLKQLVTTGLKEPRGMVVYPQEGKNRRVIMEILIRMAISILIRKVITDLN